MATESIRKYYYWNVVKYHTQNSSNWNTKNEKIYGWYLVWLELEFYIARKYARQIIDQIESWN